MARIAHVVAPGMPHHITQRGNRRLPVFFRDADYRTYLSLLSNFCAQYQVTLWAYCLMPNHVHLVAVTEHGDGLRCALGETHRCYTRHVNFREGWRRHLWQERFASFVMDYRHTLAAVRYIELNPVRDGLAPDAGTYPWSSARAHLSGTDDGVVHVALLCSEINDWKSFPRVEEEEGVLSRLHHRQRTGRPCGDTAFISHDESLCGHALHCKKPGPKGKRDER